MSVAHPPFLLSRPVRRDRVARLTRAASLAALTALAASARSALAAPYYITADTYIDSYNDTVTDRQNLNFGAAQTVKFVTSDSSSSSQFPFAQSAVRALVQLPPSFWSDIGSGPVGSASVSYTVKNDQAYGSAAQAIRPVQLYPLTVPFVAGSGGNSGSSFNGSGGTVGASWLTTDGTTSWTMAGGDYDAANEVNGVENGTGAGATFTWNITALVNNATTRAELQQDGLLIKLYNDTTAANAADPAQPYPNPQVFASLYSYDGAAGNVAQEPFATFTAVPEPATIAIVGTMAGLTLLRRRRHVSR